MSKNKLLSPVFKKLQQAALFIKERNLDDAKKIYLKLIKTIPSNPEVLTNLGTIEIYLGEIENGVNLLMKSILIDQNQPNALSNLSQGLIFLNRYEDALIYIEKAISINPNSAEFFNNRGTVLQVLKRYELALESFEKAISIYPNSAEFFNNCGTVLQDLKRYEHALESFEKAISIYPNSAEFFNNRGTVLQDLKRYELALESFEKAIETNPNHSEALFNKSLLYLFKKNFNIGWELYESRLNLKIFKEIKFKTDKPILDKNSINATKILLWGEQGIGDEIFFSRFIPKLVEQFGEIFIFLDCRLKSLFERSFKKIKFISDVNELKGIDYDYHIPIGNLPSLFTFNDSDINQFNKSYLISNDYDFKKISLQFNQGKKFCGISWKSKNEKFGDDKSLDLECLKPFFSIPNLIFINLQYGDVSEEIKAIKEIYGVEIQLIKDVDCNENIDDLVSLINGCDFIITISNVTAHLAGAIGKKTYLLAPNIAKNIWYWHENDEMSFWYPSIKIFRKNLFDSWSDSIELIKNDI